MKFTNKILSLLVLLSLLVSALPVYAVESASAKSEIPYTDFSGKFATSYNSTITEYDAESAAVAGIPNGFSGYVLKAAPSADGGYAAIELDFSSWNISVADIKSITFRVILPAGHREMRLLAEAAPATWVMRVVPSVFGNWCDITLDESGANFQSGMSLSSLAGSDGNLGKMCLIGRMGSSSDKGFYLDGIDIVYKEGVTDDMTAPVISYTGSSELNFKEGDTFEVDGISAYDEYDNAEASLSYEFSDGAVNAAGKLMAGTHTCTVKATDRSGNVATLVLDLVVTPDTSLIKIEDVPHIPHDINIANSTAYAGTLKELSYDEAVAKGLPLGFTNSVYEIGHGADPGYAGVCIDLSSYKIPIGIVDSISFNVLMATSYSELRMRCGNTTDWVMRCSAAPTGAWNTVILNSEGFNFFGSSKMSMLANKEGNLGSFALIGRVSGSYSPYYIDNITIKLKEDDKVAPVLNYLGETDILTSAGKAFVPNVSAYDEFENREVDLIYTWSEGAVDESGNMLEGIHTCRISATDYYGNTSYVDLNVTVGPPDVDAPVIHFSASEIYVTVGTFYRMVIVAEDNYDDVTVVEEWSDGAIDLGGRLAEGTHTLTLTATDLSGNVNVHVVTVYVLDGDSTVGPLIQCGK
jgi:hypothetical protein